MFSLGSFILTSHREEVICEEPLLTVDRQMGLNIVHPEGKVSYYSRDLCWNILNSCNSAARKNHL